MFPTACALEPHIGSTSNASKVAQARIQDGFGLTSTHFSFQGRDAILIASWKPSDGLKALPSAYLSSSQWTAKS